MKLGIIVGTTRTNRKTLQQAKWVHKTATKKDGVDAEIVDLADYEMPFFNEPMSPRYNNQREIHQSVQPWLKTIQDKDAYIFVTPEYNHSIPGVLKNAMDYITWEMKRKPSAIVSHGTAGGARAAMHLKEIISESQSVPIQNFVAMSGMSEQIDEQGNLEKSIAQQSWGPQQTLNNLLTDLKWYSDALALARAK